MNDLMIIAVQKNNDTLDRDECRRRAQREITSFSEYEDYVICNVIEPELYGENDFEEEDLIEIANMVIQEHERITPEWMSFEISEHNYSIIRSAINSFIQNIGEENWIRMMIEHYGDTHYGDRTNQLDELTEIATLDALETLYRGMSSSYFGKIVSFCANQGIELHLEEEDEITDVLYYADLIDESGRYKRLLMPSIHKAVLFSPLNSVSGSKAFIMEDTLYVSKETMFKEALFI